MHYYLYQITNLVNNKIYVGVHQTEDLNDDYFGSGIVLKSSLKKYGKENFKKNILGFFESEKDMYSAEFEIVNEEFLQREDVYNLTTGGNGFSSYSSKKANEKRNMLMETDEEFKASFSKRCSEQGILVRDKKLGCFSKESREKQLKSALSEKNILLLKENTKKMSDSKEIRDKRKNTFKKIGHQIGNKNSQYGTIWITNGIESIKIKKELLDEYILSGWNKGKNKNTNFIVEPMLEGSMINPNNVVG